MPFARTPKETCEVLHELRDDGLPKHAAQVVAYGSNKFIRLLRYSSKKGKWEAVVKIPHPHYRIVSRMFDALAEAVTQGKPPVVVTKPTETEEEEVWR